MVCSGNLTKQNESVHRVYVSVKTASHILNVEKEYIYAFEKLGFRFFGFTAVKRKHGNACLFAMEKTPFVFK